MKRDEDRNEKEDKRPRTGSSAPPKDDPSGRPLTDDEKVDEAIRESFGTSDPPAYSGTTGIGAPKKRKQTDEGTTAEKKK